MFENVHPSRVPGPFWPKRAPDRTPITKECCVLRRGLKSGPREPKGRKSAPGRCLKAPPEIEPKLRHHKPCVLRCETAFGPQMGADAFQKTACLSSARPFYKPGRAGSGKHVNLESCVSMRDIEAENETERKSAPAHFLEALNKLGIKIEEN